MSTLEIKNKKGELRTVLIDKEDFSAVNNISWYWKWSNKNRYGTVEACVNYKKFNLATFLLGKRKNFVIDHINRDPLDNRRVNFRFVSKAENCKNRLGVGAYWIASRGKWLSKIVDNKKYIHLGFFREKSDAVAAYLNAKEKILGGLNVNLK